MATVYYPGCATDELPFYVCDPCNEYEKGRIRSAGYVDKSYYATLMANPTSAAVWQTGINTEKIIIIPRTTGTLDAPDPETGTGYGDDDEEILGTNYTLLFRDPNYKQNCNFYNILAKKKGTYHAIYRTGTQTHVTPKTVTIRPAAPITENIQDNIEWNVSNTWTDTVQPCPFDTPEGIFDCFALNP